MPPSHRTRPGSQTTRATQDTAGIQHGTQAVDRAARLVQLVVTAEHPMTAVDLGALAGLPKSTTSRILAAMERNDLLARTDDGAWRPGPLFTAYAAGPQADAHLSALARPAMERLRELTGEAVHLAVARSGRVEQIAQVDATYLLGSRNWVGVPVPAHVSALGKVLLAAQLLALPVGPLDTPTECSIGEPEALGAHLAGVRSAGFATTVDELEVGLTGIAAPVLAGTSVVAALGISGPTARLQPRLLTVSQIVTQQARALSARLGRHTQEGAA